MELDVFHRGLIPDDVCRFDAARFIYFNVTVLSVCHKGLMTTAAVRPGVWECLWDRLHPASLRLQQCSGVFFFSTCASGCSLLCDLLANVQLTPGSKLHTGVVE